MKFFTPELYVRLQNLKDEEANQEWDQAVVRYERVLQDLLPRAPLSLRRLVQRYTLHDAEVLSMSYAGKTLSMTLQLDPPVEFFVVLAYTLIDSPQINRSVLPAEFCTQPAEWMYDEFGIDESVQARATKRTKRDRAPVFTHDILLSNGWELHLKFHKLKFSRPQALLPVPDRLVHSADASLTKSA
jgi:hypothetical protein